MGKDITMFIPETDFWPTGQETKPKSSWTLVTSFGLTVAINECAGFAPLPSGNPLLEETQISSQKDLG